MFFTFHAFQFPTLKNIKLLVNQANFLQYLKNIFKRTQKGTFDNQGKPHRKFYPLILAMPYFSLLFLIRCTSSNRWLFLEKIKV